MAFWEIAAVALFGGLIHKARKTAREDKEEQTRRKNAWCGFTDDISEYDFYRIVKGAKSGIKRLKSLSADGPIVYGVVRTQSGLSNWDFKIDFNDYGHLTGTYWLSSDNDDSSIPEYVADKISSSIKNFSPEYFEEIPKNVQTENVYKGNKDCKDNTILGNITVVLILFLIFAFGFLFYMDYSQKIEHQKNNEIQVVASFDNLKDESIEDAIKILEQNGFKNISTSNMEDLIIGWFSKEGEIESISINGDKDFSKGNWFPVDAIVVITYHGFPEN